MLSSRLFYTFMVIFPITCFIEVVIAQTDENNNTSTPTGISDISLSPTLTIRPTISSKPSSPTVMPSFVPTLIPTYSPSGSPTETPRPSPSPTTEEPTVSYRPTPVGSSIPSNAPSTQIPSSVPSVKPTSTPTVVASNIPTLLPTIQPSNAPTRVYTTITTANFSITMEGFRALNAKNRIHQWEDITSNHTKNYWNSRPPCTVDSKVRNVTTGFVMDRKIREAEERYEFMPNTTTDKELSGLPDITEIVFYQNITYDVNGDVGGYFDPVTGRPTDNKTRPIEFTLVDRPFQDDFTPYADQLFETFKTYIGRDEEIVLVEFSQWNTEAPTISPSSSPTTTAEEPAKPTVLGNVTNNSTTGLIVGIVIGCLVGLATSLYFYFKYRNEKKKRYNMLSVRSSTRSQQHPHSSYHSSPFQSSHNFNFNETSGDINVSYRSDDGGSSRLSVANDNSSRSGDVSPQKSSRKASSSLSSGVLEGISEELEHHPENTVTQQQQQQQQQQEQKPEEEEEPFMLSSQPPSLENNEAARLMRQQQQDGEAMLTPHQKTMGQSHSFDESELADSFSSGGYQSPYYGDEEEVRFGGGEAGLEPRGNLFTPNLDGGGGGNGDTQPGDGRSRFILEINEIDDLKRSYKL